MLFHLHYAVLALPTFSLAHELITSTVTENVVAKTFTAVITDDDVAVTTSVTPVTTSSTFAVVPNITSNSSVSVPGVPITISNVTSASPTLAISNSTTSAPLAAFTGGVSRILATGLVVVLAGLNAMFML